MEIQNTLTEDQDSGMIWENGLLIYRTRNPLPDHIIDAAVHRMREERARHVLGDHSSNSKSPAER